MKLSVVTLALLGVTAALDFKSRESKRVVRGIAVQAEGKRALHQPLKPRDGDQGDEGKIVGHADVTFCQKNKPVDKCETIQKVPLVDGTGETAKGVCMRTTLSTIDSIKTEPNVICLAFANDKCEMNTAKDYFSFVGESKNLANSTLSGGTPDEEHVDLTKAVKSFNCALLPPETTTKIKICPEKNLHGQCKDIEATVHLTQKIHNEKACIDPKMPYIGSINVPKGVRCEFYDNKACRDEGKKFPYGINSRAENDASQYKSLLGPVNITKKIAGFVCMPSPPPLPKPVKKGFVQVTVCSERNFKGCTKKEFPMGKEGGLITDYCVVGPVKALSLKVEASGICRFFSTADCSGEAYFTPYMEESDLSKFLGDDDKTYDFSNYIKSSLCLDPALVTPE